MTMLALSSLPCLAWAILILLRHGFWRADQRLPESPQPTHWPDVICVIPARNEAGTIGNVLGAHGANRYPGPFHVILVDDGSTDGTGEIARRASETAGRPIRVETAPPLAPGWSGKLSALARGIEVADMVDPDAPYLLLTDADIRHAPDTLARLVALAEARGLALVSLMARLDRRGLWGGLLIPAFVFFFQKLYPFPAVNEPSSAIAGAAGGCVLLRRDALAGIGGIAAIRGALIDDCTLAERVKSGPPRRAIWLGLADREVISLRDNRRLGAIWTMVARTAYTQLGRSPALLLGATLGMALVYLAGPALALSWPLHGGTVPALLGAAAWAMMAAAYWPTLRLYGGSAPEALALPLAALLYMAMTLDSARRHWLGRGGAWKGRTYPAG